MSKGLVYFVSWENDLSLVKIGFSGSLHKRLRSISGNNAHRLMIRKVLLAEQGQLTEALIRDKFKSLREVGDWFRLEPPLMEFLQKEEDQCTWKAGGPAMGARIGMALVACIETSCPVPKRLANGIKTCRHYVLWLLNDAMQNNVKMSIKDLASHPLNNGHFALKTIYNEVRMLEQRDMIPANRDNGLLLTLFGLKELDRWNAKAKMNY